MSASENLSLVSQFAHTLLPGSMPPHVERVTEGMSTFVYRLTTPEQIFYLRILPETEASFAPEVAVHNRLRELGVRAPEIVFFEHYNPLFERSVMMTREIPGHAIGYGDPPDHLASILLQAGRELAVINQIPMQGYGWVRRDSAELKLDAEYPSLSLWLHAHFAAPLRALTQSGALPPEQAVLLPILLERACERFASEPAFLAHGDFDPTHIFYDETGYQGVIDFGEIRGAHRLYDLAHFALESGDWLPLLLTGYAEVATLEEEARSQIDLMSTLIAARRMGRCILQNRPVHPPDLAFVTDRLHRTVL
jgi:aminoglycoside phosphotransferase (APT) family kinase protein